MRIATVSTSPVTHDDPHGTSSGAGHDGQIGLMVGAADTARGEGAFPRQ
jgi:hypothetical protein